MIIHNIKPYFRLRSDINHYLARTGSHTKRHPNRASPPSTSWTIPALCAAYSWPRKARGRGKIAIVELGGGWHTRDVEMAFRAMGQPVPHINNHSVDGTTNNSPGSDADGEVALDIQVAGASFFCATGVPASIGIYWGQDIAACVRAATAHGCDVCSISWGAAESVWGAAGLDDMEAAAAEATAAGMIVLAASGDNDSYDSTSGPTVDAPACCPHVIGCGGTSKPGAGVETVWNNTPGQANGEGTGGGYSSHFPVQAWQIGARPPPTGLGRMVPDIAADADPQTGIDIILNGQVQIFGGTSGVAPLYAGLLAAAGHEARLGYTQILPSSRRLHEHNVR